MYLYQDLNRGPSTIVGYRTAIVDTFGPAGDHIAQSLDLHRLLSSFHRDRPKSSRNLPKWNFYCVNTTYLVDRCICPAPCRSRQTLEKNVLSWALAGTGSVLFTRQVAVQPTCRYTAHACACALPLFVWRHI